jgi:hypothetical protein
MSHATVILHEKYQHEHIPDWEHEVVHSEMGAVNFLRVASQNGVDHHLPRACYFSPVGTTADVDRAWQNIKRRLGREVSMELTIGPSYGLGLKPVANFAAAPSLIPHAIPSPAASFYDAIVAPLAPAPKLPRLDALSALGIVSETNPYGSLFGIAGKPK